MIFTKVIVEDVSEEEDKNDKKEEEEIEVAKPNEVTQSSVPISSSAVAKGKDKIVENPKVSVTEKTYPPPPFPNRLVDQRVQGEFAKFWDRLKSLHINIPFVEALANMPKYAKFMKDVLGYGKNDSKIFHKNVVESIKGKTLDSSTVL